jgi:hypothetical protein
MCTGAQDGRDAKAHLEDAGVVYVRPARRAVNQRPRQAAAICVEENVERCGWPSSIEIGALRVHFGDLPSLACGNDEVVGGKVAKGGKRRFEILRADAGCPRVV